ncbi:MAG: hypothetical protein C4341_00010 [Armatimonadota bacterium]
MRAEWANRIFFVLVCIGLFVAVYIGVHHLAGVSPPCGEVQGGCDEIAKPKNSMFLGVPIALFGAGGYFLLALMSFARGVLGPERSPRLGMAMWLLSAIGTAISIGLVIWGVRILNATCLWCLMSAGTMTAAFLVQTYAMLQSGAGARPANYTAYVAIFALSVAGSLGFGFASLNKIREENSGVVLKGDRTQEELLRLILGKERIVYGSADAPITIVEFSDLFCPVCATEHAWMKQQLDGPLNGKVRLGFRHFPIQQLHAFARHAAAAAELVHERHPDKFWKFIDTFFAAQGDDDIMTILQVAEASGVPQSELDRMFKDTDVLRKYLQPVAEDMTDASALGVQSTPHFFVLLPQERDGVKVLYATGGLIRDIVEGAEFQAALRRVR